MILRNSGTGLVHADRILIIGKKEDVALLPLQTDEQAWLTSRLENEQHVSVINRYSSRLLIVMAPEGKEGFAALEAWRRKGNEAAKWANEEKIKSLEISSFSNNQEQVTAFVEGMLLGSYQFLRYQSKAEKIKHSLQEIWLNPEIADNVVIEKLNIITAAVSKARDLVNEPVITLNSSRFAETLSQMGEEAGVAVECFSEEKIRELGMGGLLAVNKGSIDPPGFICMEWKPENAINEKPVVLVGKGVVFDTGGLSLKPTAKSMDYMKSDMAGGAAVSAAICAAAKLQMPLHLITLVPATDNRPGGNAITPGDVITISNGATVEVLNTDAEGRLILADALSYAQRYDPMLVIDLATLTGSAAMTLGIHGIAAMANESENHLSILQEAGLRVNERIVELPLWEEYDELIKSTIADMKNIGGPEAGAISAGKFLQRFTTYPWIHLDIAGPAFLHAADHYRPAGGTATGVRLLLEFFRLLEQRIGTGLKTNATSSK